MSFDEGYNQKFKIGNDSPRVFLFLVDWKSFISAVSITILLRS